MKFSWPSFFSKKKVAPAPQTRYIKTIEIAQELHHDTILAEKQSRITAANNMVQQFAEENGTDSLIYRKGASFTADFGISEGWGENFSPGYIRIHPGVDRARGGSIEHGGKVINDVVISPFNFDASDYVLYGPKTSYGFLVILINNKYGFNFTIAHMNPNSSFIPWSLSQIKSKKPFGKNWILGSAGTYGYSTGAHTHTEFVSIKESCDLFEQLLIDQFGVEVNKEYTDEFIISQYRKVATAYPKTSPYGGMSDDAIRRDWLAQKRAKGVIFINKYKYIYTAGDKTKTRYATNMVFKGL